MATKYDDYANEFETIEPPGFGLALEGLAITR